MVWCELREEDDEGGEEEEDDEGAQVKPRRSFAGVGAG